MDRTQRFTVEVGSSNLCAPTPYTGKVAEVGAPEELERKAGAFWSLYFGQGSQLGSIAH
jgi:hypothetical protein